jgi:hypothetical protein
MVSTDVKTQSERDIVCTLSLEMLMMVPRVCQRRSLYGLRLQAYSARLMCCLARYNAKALRHIRCAQIQLRRSPLPADS